MLRIADEVGAYLKKATADLQAPPRLRRVWVDMAHFAGLVAAGLHPSPVPHAQATTGHS